MGRTATAGLGPQHPGPDRVATQRKDATNNAKSSNDVAKPETAPAGAQQLCRRPRWDKLQRGTDVRMCESFERPSCRATRLEPHTSY